VLCEQAKQVLSIENENLFDVTSRISCLNLRLIEPHGLIGFLKPENDTFNHIHLLVKDIGRGEISKRMQLAAGRVAQSFNQRKSRKGASWEKCNWI